MLPGLPKINMDKKTKTFVIVGLIVLVLFIGVAIYYYKKGKKTVSIQEIPSDLPGNPGSGSGTTGASNAEIKLVAQQLYSDMKGWNWAGHNYEPYTRALVFSDSDIVKLYNTFNTLYQTESGETLVQFMDNEAYADSDVPDALLQRFAKLNLK
jgi:hypothetical protein